MLYTNIAPSADLAPWVKTYQLIEFDASVVMVPGFSVTQHSILINYGDSVRVHFEDGTVNAPWDICLRGMLNNPWRCEYQGSARFIAVDLHAATLHHLIRDSVSMLTNQAADICHFGFRVDNELMDTLRHPQAGVAGKIAAVENYLRLIFARLPDNAFVRPSLLANLEALKQRPYTGGDFDYTEVHLRREFLRKFGISPHQYRDISRVVQAYGYLGNPARFSVARIAQELDFHDAPHFNRTFKRYTAMTPTEYRDQANANPMDVLHRN